MIGCMGLMLGKELLLFPSLPCIHMMHYRAVGHALCTRYNPCLGYPGFRPTVVKKTGRVLKLACLHDD